VIAIPKCWNSNPRLDPELRVRCDSRGAILNARLLELESKVGIKFGGRNGFCFMDGDPRLGMKSGFWNEV
jgi:hypothetical protein